MGAGIEWMVAVSVWVASLPGAVGRVTAFGTGPLLLGSAGLIVLGLLRSPLRWAGALLVALAALGAIRTPLPDVLIAPYGASFALRTAGGRLAMLRTGSDSFAIQQWLAADADARSAKDKELVEGIRCDDAGCIGRLADGAIVAIVRRPEAFEEDCRRAAVVVQHAHGAARLRRPRHRSRGVAARWRHCAASCGWQVGHHSRTTARPRSALGARAAHGGGGSIAGATTPGAARCHAANGGHGAGGLIPWLLPLNTV
jgi:hypothetical protein